MDKKAADPINLKIARYRPKEINRGNENPIAAINTIRCIPSRYPHWSKRSPNASQTLKAHIKKSQTITKPRLTERGKFNSDCLVALIGTTHYKLHGKIGEEEVQKTWTSYFSTINQLEMANSTWVNKKTEYA